MTEKLKYEENKTRDIFILMKQLFHSRLSNMSLW